MDFDDFVLHVAPEVCGMLVNMKQIGIIAFANFRKWKKNPKIWLAFGLGFVLSFLLSDKVIVFAKDKDTVLQVLEPFIWTFGDAKSILTISLCLLLIFSDMPNLSKETPFLLIRVNRAVWMLGQIFYTVTASTLFTGFILLATSIVSGRNAYAGNMWSETAAILAYSDIGREIAVPSVVKVLELSFPYQCGSHIFLLMTGYSLLLSALILYFNLWRQNGGMIAGILFSAYGFLVNPEMLSQILRIPEEQMAKANILFGWISPLNHATYAMHNFGYDNLPKLWVSYLAFFVGSLFVFGIGLHKIQRYTFDFTG